MSVRQSPMGIPANPTAAPFDVVPMMTYKKKKVAMTSTQEARCKTIFAGTKIAVPVGRKPPGNPVGFARGDHVEYRRRRNSADHLCKDVGQNVGGLEPPSGPQPDGDGGIEMPTGNVTDRIGHGQYGQSKGEADPEKSDAERRKTRGKHCTATTGEC